MKNDLKLFLAMAALLGLPAAAHAASAKLTQAQITQIVKDVKTIDPGKAARPATMKETVQGLQAVRTGVESRTELLFNDRSITRLGANTHFSFTEGTREMSLESGVMLLQVPKGIGGAKIETSAVTAGITGTTIMLEAGKGFTKLIVLEGECCLWPKKGRLAKRKICATAGEEIVLLDNAKDFPAPLFVNLKVLERTSLLITGRWNSPLNPGPINAAAAGQAGGNFTATGTGVVGPGTDVTIIQGRLPGSPPAPPTQQAPPVIVPQAPPPRQPPPTIPGGGIR